MEGQNKHQKSDEGHATNSKWKGKGVTITIQMTTNRSL